MYFSPCGLSEVCSILRMCSTKTTYDERLVVKSAEEYSYSFVRDAICMEASWGETKMWSQDVVDTTCSQLTFASGEPDISLC